MAIDLHVRCGWASSPNRFHLHVSGTTVLDAVGQCVHAVARGRQEAGLHASEPDLVESISGVPPWAMARTRRDVVFSLQEGTPWLRELQDLEPLLDWSDLLVDAWMVAEGRDEPSERLLEALDTQSFQRACAEAGVPMSGLATALGCDPDERSDYWQGLLFDTPPTCSLDPASAASLDAILRSLYQGGDDIIRDETRFRADGGACGLWASVLDRVMETGGRYIVVGSSSMDPCNATGCSHIAVRVGNWVVDGRGVHHPYAFTQNWSAGWRDVHELETPDNGGLVQAMRNEPGARRLLDESSLEAALRAAGIGPHMLREPVSAPEPQALCPGPRR